MEWTKAERWRLQGSVRRYEQVDRTVRADAVVCKCPTARVNDLGAKGVCAGAQPGILGMSLDVPQHKLRLLFYLSNQMSLRGASSDPGRHGL